MSVLVFVSSDPLTLLNTDNSSPLLDLPQGPAKILRYYTDIESLTMLRCLRRENMLVLPHLQLTKLLQALQTRGYDVIGPQRREGAIVYAPLTSVEQLPQGWTELQEAGSYRLKRRDDDAMFGFTVGPQSWKKQLMPPRRRLWKATPAEDGMKMEFDPLPATPLAFLGVRACELHAIEIQDRILKDGPYPDEYYSHRRQSLFLISVQCTEAGATCFCTSMNTGPRAEAGFDLALTEIVDAGGSWFLVEVGSEKGQEVIASLALEEASEEQVNLARQLSDKAASQMGRSMNTEGLPALLDEMREHRHWEEIGERCLSCSNCTLVCPTCFCSSVEDHTELGSPSAERVKRWDSCFHEDFSYLVGGAIRKSTASRYRQWMTHKLSSWVEQFGTMGCVGCGRCIAWCPVGIDLTEEAAVFQNLARNDGHKANEGGSNGTS